MGNYSSVTPDFDEAYFGAGIVGIFYLIYFLVMMAIGVGSYVFQSLGFYTVAKRRGIKKPWLSWLPVGNMWILGCISDQYQYVVKGKVKNKRKALLVLSILMSLLTVVLFVLYAAFIWIAIEDSHSLDAAGAAVFLALIPVSLAVSGISIAIVVIQYIALYDLFTSCDPKNDILYLLLSIFVSITMPILVFMCRNKDLGMPPRKQDPAAFIPPEPVDVPPWRPVQNTVDPWENNSEQ